MLNLKRFSQHVNAGCTVLLMVGSTYTMERYQRTQLGGDRRRVRRAGSSSGSQVNVKITFSSLLVGPDPDNLT